MPIETKTASFLDRYEAHAREVVSHHLPDREGEWDAEVCRLRELDKKQERPLRICFLGPAGIGKSTLINALVAGCQTVLPAGGIGSLTAQALSVEYGAPRLEVQYHPPAVINRIRFVLETEMRRDAQKSAGDTPDGPDHLAEDEVTDLTAQLEDPDAKKRLVEHYLQQASLMITGRPRHDGRGCYLIDGLRTVLGNEPAFGTAFHPEDAARIRYLRAATKLSRKGKGVSIKRGGPNDRKFANRLHDHAAGYLAPVIREMRVTWDSQLLGRGVTLIDLPGVGIASDSYRKATEQAMQDARAVILVVNYRGIDTASADLLRTTGFLNRLLYAADHPEADPVVLFVAVVRMDEVAEAKRAEERGFSDIRRPLREHLAESRGPTIEHIRGQMCQQLREVWQAGDVGLSDAQEVVIERILRGLTDRIHPVSAKEYRKLLQGDEEERPFIKKPEESGVPGLARCLGELAEQVRAERAQSLGRQIDYFRDKVVSSLRVFQPAESLEQMTAAATRTRGELLDYLGQLREEFLRRQGAFRAFWDGEVSQLLETEIQKANAEANRRIRGYLGTLRGYHWATLRAAVARGGTYFGAKNVNLPLDLSLCFDTAIAEIWGDPLLRRIRERTCQFGQACLALVEDALSWVKDREVGPLIEPFQRVFANLDAEVSDLAAVGEYRTEKMRERVRTHLVNEVQRPIRDGCLAFLRRGEANGAGARDRIIGLFGELADDVSKAARGVASRLMSDCIAQARQAVTDHWKGHDPLSQPIKLAQNLSVRRDPTPEQLRDLRIWQEIEAALARLEPEPSLMEVTV